MQANADQVERDILETQKRLQQVRPDGQAARCGGMGGPLSCRGVPTDHGEDGTDDFVLHWPLPKQWNEGFFSVGLLIWGLEGGPALPCVLEPTP